MRLAAIALATLACATEPAPPPHMVLVVVDTLRDDAVDPRSAPALTSLAQARGGQRLPRTFAHAPMTLPSHTALFTARLPHETGVLVNGQRVPEELLLLPEHLAAQGYRTLAVASMATMWHDEPGAGLDQGFERFVRVERDYADGLATAAALSRLLDEELGLAGTGLAAAGAPGQAAEGAPGQAAEGGVLGDPAGRSGGGSSGTRGQQVAGASGSDVAGSAIEDPARDERPLFLLVHLADPHEPYRTFGGASPDLGLYADGVEVARADPRAAPHVTVLLDLDAGAHELVLAGSGESFLVRSAYAFAVDGSEGAPGGAPDDGEAPTADRGATLAPTTDQGSPLAPIAGRDATLVPGPGAGLGFPADDPRRLPLRWVEGARLERLERAVLELELRRPTRVALELWVTDRPDQAEARRRYGAEVRRADGAVEAVLADLDRRGLLEDAVVLFTSDHGEAFGEHGRNGHSHQLYDHQLRVPTILRLPPDARFDRARARLAERGDGLVRHVDLAPTLLDLAGLAPLPDAVGISLLADDGPRVHFAETHPPEADEELLALFDGRWKLIHAPASGRFELYDLAADPGERDDLWARRAADFEAWRAALEARAGADAAARERTPDLEALGY